MSHLPFGWQNSSPLALAINLADVSAASVEQHTWPQPEVLLQATAPAETAVSAVTSSLSEEKDAEGGFTRLVDTAAFIDVLIEALVRKVLAEAVIVMAQRAVTHIVHTNQVYSHGKAQHSMACHCEHLCSM